MKGVETQVEHLCQKLNISRKLAGVYQATELIKNRNDNYWNNTRYVNRLAKLAKDIDLDAVGRQFEP